MRNVFSALWADERGFLVSSELIIISTILVLGLIVGMSTLQNAIVMEFQDLAFAFSSLNQSFGVVGYRGCKGSFSAGSFFLSAANRFCGAGSYGYGNGYGYGYGVAGGGDFGYGYGANYGYGGMAVPGPAVVGPAPCADGDCVAAPCDVPGGCDTCPDGNCTPATAPNGQLQPVPTSPTAPQAEPKPAP